MPGYFREFSRIFSSRRLVSSNLECYTKLPPPGKKFDPRPVPGAPCSETVQTAQTVWRGPSLQVAIEKLVQAVICIVRGLAIVFKPVTKHVRTGLEMPVIESMVRA